MTKDERIAELEAALYYFANLDVSSGNPHWPHIQKAKVVLSSTAQASEGKC